MQPINAKKWILARASIVKWFVGFAENRPKFLDVPEELVRGPKCVC
jgi:hypothetical protein